MTAPAGVMTTSKTTALRKRAEAIGCRVHVFGRTYRFMGKPVRYAFIDKYGERYASNLLELRSLVQRSEKIAEKPTILPILPTR
jgi:hypothetical protein